MIHRVPELENNDVSENDLHEMRSWQWLSVIPQLDCGNQPPKDTLPTGLTGPLEREVKDSESPANANACDSKNGNRAPPVMSSTSPTTSTST
ncbi:unnamed protein product, partial [Trichobilharzia regenti]